MSNRRVIPAAATLVFAAVALGACAGGLVGGDPSTASSQRSSAILAAKTFADADLASATPEAPAAAWWRAFDDPTLDRLVGESLVANRTVRIAAANLRGAQALAAEAARARGPTGGFSGALDRNRAALPGLDRQPDRTTADVGLTASWEVDLRGRVAALEAVALADVETADALRRAAALGVAADTVRAYADLRSAQSRLARARRSADLQDDTASLVDRALAAGRGIPADVAAARAQARTTRALIPALQRDITSATRRLAALQGRAPDDLPAFADGPPLRVPSRVAVGLPGDALARRPDVAAAEARLRRADAEIAAAAAALRPSIAFTVTGGATADLGEIVSGGLFRFGVGPSISWPIFERDRLHLRRRAAEAGAEAAYLTWEDTAIRGLQEAADALTAVGRERERRVSLVAAERDADIAAAAARTRHRAGLVPLREVLDADRRALDAEAAAAEAGSAETAAFIALNQALGLHP